MKLRFVLMASLLSLLVGLPCAHATVIVSLVGDEDNFVWTAADPPLMDIETADFPNDYVATYVLGVMVPTSAWLEVHWSGVGTCCGDDQVLVNGNVIWSRADYGGPGDPT